MNCTYSPPACPEALASFDAERRLPELQVKRPVRLVIETIVVTGVALAAIRILHVQRPSLQWLAVPLVLAVASLAPTWIAGRTLGPIGLDSNRAGMALGVVCRTLIYILPGIVIALWLMKRLAVPIPLRTVVGPQHDWLTWLLYQFLYVAVPEELFFRGYLQANVMKVLSVGRWRSSRTDQGLAVLISAACFALAHVIVQGNTLAAATFLPGVVMAWLFLRTRSLLAPILFHGLANTTYAVLAMTLS